METLVTERLILRPFRESDFDDLFGFLSQLRDDEFEGYPGLTHEKCSAQLAERVGSEEYYAVVWKDSDRVVGNIYCGKRAYQAREVGYIIREEYWRLGVAREALTAVVDALFRSGVHRVYAECDPRNTASWRLLEAAGFHKEAHFRENCWFHTIF